MGLFSPDDRQREITGQEPWERPEPQPVRRRLDWRPFIVALAAFALLLGAALYLALH